MTDKLGRLGPRFFLLERTKSSRVAAKRPIPVPVEPNHAEPLYVAAEPRLELLPALDAVANDGEGGGESLRRRSRPRRTHQALRAPDRGGRLLTAVEARARTAQGCRRRGSQAKADRVESPLVMSITRSYEGERAVSRPDPGGQPRPHPCDREVRLPARLQASTYATWWIRQSITRALAEQGRTIRLPVHVADQVRRVTRGRRLLAQKLNRDPSLDEIAVETGFTRGARGGRLLALVQDPVSLETPVGDGESLYGDLVEDTKSGRSGRRDVGAAPLDRAGGGARHAQPASAPVLGSRFGLDGAVPQTLEEVGAELGVTRERVRQLETRAPPSCASPRPSSSCTCEARAAPTDSSSRSEASRLGESSSIWRTRSRVKPSRRRSPRASSAPHP